ncbi:MAG: TetR/AcrR family transcriptional regulator [Muribaculaceae bacterium]
MKEPKSPEITDAEARILAAAEKEIMVNGFAGTRTATIAQAAGVSHALLHYYFRTKDQLLERIITEKMSTFASFMVSAFGDASLPLFDRLRNGIEQHFDYFSTNPELPYFVINEVYRYPERLKLMTDSITHITTGLVSDLQSQIDEAAAKHLCRRVDATMLMIDIVSLNLFAFIGLPVIGTIFGHSFGSRDNFLKQRKAENVETIMKKISL